MKKIRFKLSTKRSALLIASILVLVGGSAYAINRWRADDAPLPPTITTNDGKEVSLAPPTKEEKKEVEDHKSELAKAATSSETPTSQAKTSSVIITSPSPLNPSPQGVRAYVSGVFEDGGMCTATAMQGTTTITKSSTGFANVSYTQCAPINWDSLLGNGKWTITVSYKSATTNSSQSVIIEVK